MLLNDVLELVWLHWLRQAVFDANRVDSLVGVWVVIPSDGDDHDLWQFGLLGSETCLLSEDSLRGLTAIHDRHVDVGQDYPIAHVATGLLHVLKVHVKQLLAIVGLIALKPVLLSKYVLNRYHVEHKIVSEQDCRLTAALVLLGRAHDAIALRMHVVGDLIDVAILLGNRLEPLVVVVVGRNSVFHLQRDLRIIGVSCMPLLRSSFLSLDVIVVLVDSL